MKKLAYTVSFLLLTCGAFAQDLTDALRYSDHRISGTARSEAMGNAFGALGGDFSSLSINPAGLGVYRSGEFTFSTSVGKTSIDGTYLGKTENDSKYNVGINNLGYVVTIPSGQNSESGLVSVSFGFGFNRLASFSMNSFAEGENAQNSLLDYFTNNANSGMYSNYYEDLAVRSNLLFQDNGPYQNDLTNAGFGQSQQKTIDSKGHINEWLISLGANFNHKFYVGATIGILDVFYRQNANLYEWDANNNIPFFNNYDFNTYLKDVGTGYNLKIGAIYKPIENLRLGLAFHTPTFYKFNEEYDSGIRSSITLDGVTKDYTEKPEKAGAYDFEMETPLKTILSAAYVIGKLGLISVDYEIVDYSTAKLKSIYSEDNFIAQNQTIKRTYKTVGNLHIGGELRVNSVFSLRAGYENYPSAFKSNYKNSIANSSSISGGFGFKQGDFFFDASMKRNMSENYVKIYPDPSADEMIKNSVTKNNVIFTLGYKF